MANNNLKIGRYIKFALHDLGVQVFPIGQDGLNAGKVVTPPFVTYKRNQFQEESTKDSIYEGAVTVAIDIVAKTYEQMIDVVASVQTAMHSAPTAWNEQSSAPFWISDQSLQFGDEQMDETMTMYVCEVTATVETEDVINN